MMTCKTSTPALNGQTKLNSSLNRSAIADRFFITLDVRQRKCYFNLPANYTDLPLAENMRAPASRHHCGKLDKLPVRPAPALEQRTFEELLPRFEAKKVACLQIYR
jgi:hypothetical protein